MRGRFITLEGIDGAGKSTHMQWLDRRLAERGIRVIATREPGGTHLGERLRELLLDRDQRLGAETETLLMFAARREHVETVIVPALDAGTWVLCDRFTDASYAYQSGGSGVAWAKIALLEQWVHPHLQPDATILFDASPEIAGQRARRERAADRFEREDPAYFHRVREAYLRRARDFPDRIHVIDSNGGLDEVRKQLEESIATICK
jgi:dTMP kinase